jgi:small subunit ribosomal protein S6e
MKIVYSDRKSGKTAQAEVAKEGESRLIGLKIGDQLEGSAVGIEGVKLQITGLSDNTGAPSRKEIDGSGKVWPLISSGVGIRGAKNGYRHRRMVRGNAISPDTVQINTVILEHGSRSLEELFKPKEKKEQ